MRNSILAIISLLFLSSILSAQTAFPKGSELLFDSAMKKINKKHVSWVKKTAAEVNAKNLTETDVRNRSSQYAVLGNMKGQDIEALAFLVLMQAAKSAQEDLKAIMASVKSINNAKTKQREMLEAVQKHGAKTAGKFDSLKFQSNKAKAILGKQNPDTVKFRSSGLRTAPSKAQLDALIDNMKNDLDSMSEMGETESLRLQMAMDRLSKMMSTLSNILKKLADTADAITANLK